jgi:hypothetical protein
MGNGFGKVLLSKPLRGFIPLEALLFIGIQTDAVYIGSYAGQYKTPFFQSKNT